MDRAVLIRKLNWFYSLELNQVDLYQAQSQQVDDIYIGKTLERVAVIEQQHVDNIAEVIKEMGAQPTAIGDMLAPIVGKVAGKTSGWAGVINMLKMDIKLEEKAMADYKDLIAKSAADQNLFNLLWSNLIDEDLHTAWFSNKVAELESIKH